MAGFSGSFRSAYASTSLRKQRVESFNEGRRVPRTDVERAIRRFNDHQRSQRQLKRMGAYGMPGRPPRIPYSSPVRAPGMSGALALVEALAGVDPVDSQDASDALNDWLDQHFPWMDGKIVYEGIQSFFDAFSLDTGAAPVKTSVVLGTGRWSSPNFVSTGFCGGPQPSWWKKVAPSACPPHFTGFTLRSSCSALTVPMPVAPPTYPMSLWSEYGNATQVRLFQTFTAIGPTPVPGAPFTVDLRNVVVPAVMDAVPDPVVSEVSYGRSTRGYRRRPYQVPALEVSAGPGRGVRPPVVVNHDELPPGRDKERKYKLPRSKLADVFGKITEVSDFVDCAAKNITRKTKSGKTYRPCAQIGRLQDRIACVMSNLDDLELDEFVKCLVVNEVEDRVIGKANQLANRITKNDYYRRPVGVGRGGFNRR